MKNHSKSIGLFQKSGSGLYSQMLMEILIFVSIPTFAALTILLIFLAYTTEEISFSPKK